MGKKKTKSTAKQQKVESDNGSPLYQEEQDQLDLQQNGNVNQVNVEASTSESFEGNNELKTDSGDENQSKDTNDLNDANEQTKDANIVIVRDVLSLFHEYRKYDLSYILSCLDLDSDSKQLLVELFHKLNWITSDEEYAHLVFIAALYNEWEIAKFILELIQPSQKVHWIILRKLIANWSRFRDRRQLREMCIKVMQADPKAMPTLNEWARNKGKEQNIIIKGYCDLCQGESKVFAMSYSEL
jgi:hypothetical protein